jgi:flagellar hook-associated protein 2
MSTASSSAIFNGTSRFSSDFQSVLTRAVSIASLPITQLNSHVTLLQAQATALGSLDSKFSALQSAINGLQSATGVNALNASVADHSIASVSLSTGAAPAAYSLEVTSLGAFSNTLSTGGLTTVSDPSTQNLYAATSFTLSVDGSLTTFVPQSNTLTGLADAINSQAGANVQASIVNVGSNSIPDYRLSIQSTKLGPVAIQLQGGTTDLLSTLSSGSLASYKINGLTTDITSDSRTVTLAPGVSATLTGQSATGVATNITVSSQTQGFSNGLAAFVSAYNSATDEVAKNRGATGGALQGQSLIGNLTNTLQQLGNYSTGASGIGSLTDLGITYDQSGHLSFDTSLFSSVTTGQIASLTSFLGTSTSGGFLQTAASILTTVEDSTSGVIKGATNTNQLAISSSQLQISTQQDRVNTLQKNLQAQLAKSDALVASLEQSYSVLSGLIQAQTVNATSLNNGF